MQGMKFTRQGGKTGSGQTSDVAGELTKGGVVPGKSVTKAKTEHFGKGGSRGPEGPRARRFK